MCGGGLLPKRKVIELVGKRPQIDCEIGGTKTKALWDTGSQVNLLSLLWLKTHDVNYKMDNISDVIGRELSVLEDTTFHMKGLRFWILKWAK